jgi:hypothetical protein
MALADPSAPDAPPVPQDNGQAAFNFFTGQGLAPHQAAGIVGNLQGESDQGLNPNAINKGDGSDGSDSIGIGQWNGTRAQALKDYAASKGAQWNDLNTQLEFLHSELKGPEAKAYAGLTAAKTPEEAGQAMLAYERPKDWNKPGAHPERAQYAAKAFASYGGGQPQTPQASPASPANAPLNLIPPQAPPIFAQQPQAAPQQQQAAAPAPFEQIPPMQQPPIFFAPRRSPDLSRLRAAFAPPVFGRG